MREAWIDRWKGLLILLVVLGHTVGGGGKIAEGRTADILMDVRHVIYLFHMPAFFILAGLCFAPPDDGILKIFIVKRFRRLLVPYFVFGIASWLIYDMMYGKWSEFGMQMVRLATANDEFRCNSVLWFLPTMFNVILLAVASSRLLRNRKLIALVMAMDFLLFFWLRYNHIKFLPFMMFKVLEYYFYFMVGFETRKFRGTAIPDACLLWVFAGFVAYAAFCHLTACNTRPFAGYAFWMLKGLVGAIITAALAKTLPNRGFRWLEWIGGMSMGIMLVHKFPLVAVQEHIPGVRAMFGNDMSFAWLGVASVFIITVAVSIATTLLLRKVTPWAIGERKH